MDRCCDHAVRSGTESLLATIPSWVVLHVGLTKDDRLDWWLDKNGGVWVAKIEEA